MNFEDVEKSGLLTKPARIKTAQMLLYAALAIDAIKGFSASSEALKLVYDDRLSPVSLLILPAFLGFQWLLVNLIGKRKNWARIIKLLLFCIGAVGFSAVFLYLKNQDSFNTLLTVTQLGLEAAALGFLFHKESSAWFKCALPQSR